MQCRIENKDGEDDLSDGRTSVPMGEIGEESEQDNVEAGSPDHELVLKKPIKIAGKEFRHLDFDFDELTAADLHQASKYLKERGIPVSIPALDYEYQFTLFVRTVRKKMPEVEYADLMRLSATDAAKATGLVRDFLLDKDPGLKDLGSEE